MDVSEFIALVDTRRRTRRCTEGYLAFLSFLTMLICGVLPIICILAFEGISHECGGRPANVCEEEERKRDIAYNSLLAVWISTLIVA